MTLQRWLVFHSLGAVGAFGAFAVACGSGSSESGESVDGGSDARLDGADDTGTQDAGPAGHCSAVNTACDIVLQDCPPTEQCVAVGLADGGIGTKCVSVSSAQHIKLGDPCCPVDNPTLDSCDRGLQCSGTRCDDAGGGGECTAACCDDSTCGQDHNGFQGHCTLTQVGPNNQALYNVCLYAQSCKPFRVLPCPQGEACVLEDSTGASTCIPIDTPNGGLSEGTVCTDANSCKDGLACLSAQDAGVCTMLCYTRTGSPPFDAGALPMGPGTGGCTGNKTCRAVGGFPGWLGICE
jgi:hypothetical protein